MAGAQGISDLGLVSQSRFGAACTAARAARALSIDSVAASSRGRFSSADLNRVERGAASLSDAEVVEIAGLYDLPARVMDLASTELVLDRSTTVTASRTPPPGYEDTPIDEVLVRYLAIVSLLGGRRPIAALSVKRSDTRVLSQALGADHSEIEFRLSRMSETEQNRVLEVRYRLAERVAVPSTGLLVAETHSGSLVMVRKAGEAGMPSGPATLGGFTDQGYVDPGVPRLRLVVDRDAAPPP